jgi:AcrR family transcriptional regulator
LFTTLRISVSTALAILLLLQLAIRLDNVYGGNMNSNDNSVNIKNPARRYHHGDLRAALIETGLELLKERSADDMSLREVARRVGVSPTAVYRHFPDKQALMFALCERGAEGLAQAQRDAMEEAGGGTQGFDATGQAYVRFALANPALFRLMMTTRKGEGELQDDESLVSEAMRELRRNIASRLPPGSTPDEQRIAAIHAWAWVHGMAMLMLDGQVPASEEILASIRRG